MKHFLVFIILFLTTFKVHASDFLPSYINPHYQYGTGLVSISGEVPVYESNSNKSNLAAVIKIKNGEVIIKEAKNKNPSVDSTFIAYLENENIALLSVIEDTDDMFCICYDQKRGLVGWIQKNDNFDYMSWESFLNLYGRKKGLYTFRNIPEEMKKLYSAPDSESTLTDSFNFPKHIALWLISGNWVLVKVTTYDGQTKTGWMKWRLDDGSIGVFPDFR